MLEETSVYIERPETAEQFCQKLYERQQPEPPAIVPPSTLLQRIVRIFKALLCCNACWGL